MENDGVNNLQHSHGGGMALRSLVSPGRKEVIALFSMIVLPRAMSLGPSPDEGFMEKSYLYPQSQ
jgi:hypothetical protein